jgi:hypothetical protein
MAFLRSGAPQVVVEPKAMKDPVTAHAPKSNTPPTYLGWGVAATACCFLPFGLAGMYFGWRSSQATLDGNPADAVRSSLLARRWLIAAVVVGVLVDVVIVASLGLLGAFPSAGAQ